jgi:cell division protein FtsW (lipid II flippase)
VNGVIGSKLWSFSFLVDMNTDFVSQFARRSYGRVGFCISGVFFVWIEHGMRTVAYVDQNNFTNKF